MEILTTANVRNLAKFNDVRRELKSYAKKPWSVGSKSKSDHLAGDLYVLGDCGKQI